MKVYVCPAPILGALIEFEEFKILRSEGAEMDKMRDKLDNALREIEFAFQMYQENRRAALKNRDKVELLRSLILEAIEGLQVA